MKIQRFYIDTNLRSLKLLDVVAAYCDIAQKTGYANAKIVITPTLLSEYTNRKAWFRQQIYPNTDRTISRILSQGQAQLLDFPPPNKKDQSMLRAFESDVILKDSAYINENISEPQWPSSDQEPYHLIKDYGDYCMVHDSCIGPMLNGKDAADESMRISVAEWAESCTKRGMEKHSEIIMCSKDTKHNRLLRNDALVGGFENQLCIKGSAAVLFDYLGRELDNIQEKIEYTKEFQDSYLEIRSLKKACENRDSQRWFQSTQQKGCYRS